MQTSKFRPLIKFTSVNKNLLRSVSATATKAEENHVNDVQLKSSKEIPGPSTLPLVGALRHFIPGGKYHGLNGLALNDALRADYGLIIRLERVVGPEPFIFLFDAESVSKVLRGENVYPNRPGFKTLEYYRNNIKADTKPGRPTGLITDQGKLWQEFRSTVNPVMMQPKTMKLYTKAIDDVAMEMIDRMKFLRDDKNMIKGQLDRELNRWSLESVAVVALGTRLGCLEQNLPEDSPAMDLIKCVRGIMELADKLEFKPSLWQYYATSNYKQIMKLYTQQEQLSKYFIEKAREEMKMKKNSNNEKGILEKLLEIDENIALIMASDMLLAGVDTAANTMLGTMYLLAVNPDKQNKLRKEVRENPEKKTYLKACKKESLRMMPVAPGNFRVTSKEYNLLGYRIPPNMRIGFGHHDMALFEEHYPRAKEYIPERWLVEKDDPLHYKNAHPFAYSPFGFGARSCIGRRIAELEMETFTARLVDNFHIQWTGPPPKIELTSMNYVRGPYNFIFNDAPK